MVADVLEEDDVVRVRTPRCSGSAGWTRWVHTAAVVAYGRFEDVPSAMFRRVLDTDVHGTVHVARAALEQFREQGHGTLVLTGSLLGEIATPYMSSYVTSKWAVRGLGQGARRSRPGRRRTSTSASSRRAAWTPPSTSQAANYAGRVGRPPPPVDSPEKVAAAIVRTLVDHRPRRSVGAANLVARAGFTLVPRLFDLLVAPLMRAGGLSREPVEPHDGNVFAPSPAGDAVHGHWGRHWMRGAAAVAIVASGTAAAAVRRRSRS